MLKSNLNYNILTIMLAVSMVAITFIISHGTT